MSIDNNGSSYIPCPANGCPVPATIDSDWGRCCRYHHGKAAKDWPPITHKLRALAWLAQFITDLTDMVNDTSPRADWLAHIDGMNLGSDGNLTPSPDERRYPHAYLERLHHEFTWRVGARVNRPEPYSRAEAAEKAAAMGVKFRH